MGTDELELQKTEEAEKVVMTEEELKRVLYNKMLAICINGMMGELRSRGLLL